MANFSRGSFIQGVFTILLPSATITGVGEVLYQTSKHVILQQEDALRADKTSDITTVGFEELAKKNPWVLAQKKSIGRIETPLAPDTVALSSAILLDEQGTLVLCGHQDINNNTKIIFYSDDNTPAVFVPQNLQRDKTHDVTFATLDTKLIKHHRLIPVDIGSLDFRASSDGQYVVVIGWPPGFNGVPRLHATEGQIMGYRDTLTEISMAQQQEHPVIVKCKMLSNAVTFGGMSGGGVFYNSQLIGLVSAGIGPAFFPSMYYTPINFVREAYGALFPERARHAGISNQDVEGPNEPASCRFQRKDFILVPL